MKVILYTTHCPKCNVLMTKLKSKGVDYEEITDVDVMRDKGFMSAPMLEVDGKIMTFAEAIKWVNEVV